eukprot:3526610-Pleurochrysis_carterae.AAC.1
MKGWVQCCAKSSSLPSSWKLEKHALRLAAAMLDMRQCGFGSVSAHARACGRPNECIEGHYRANLLCHWSAGVARDEC